MNIVGSDPTEGRTNIEIKLQLQQQNNTAGFNLQIYT